MKNHYSSLFCFWFSLGVCAVVVCAALVAISSGDSLRYSDEVDYHQLAVSILNKHEFSDADSKLTAFRPPGYPGVLAALYSVIESPLAAKLLNAICLGAAAILVGLLSQRIIPSASLPVPYLMLVYPVFFYTASVLYPQIIGALLLLVVVLLLTKDKPSLLEVAIGGVIYGALCLAIPAFLMVLPLFFLYLLLVKSGNFAESIKQILVMGVATTLIIAPWTMRNAAVFGQFVPISTNTGLNLLLGNSAISSANSGVNLDVWSQCKDASIMANEVALDHALQRCATDWIQNNPADAAALYGKKVINYFNFRNDLATKTEAAQWRDWVQSLTYYPMLLIALVRLMFCRRVSLNRTELLVYLLYFGNALVSAVFFTRIRFRIPFDFLLVIVEAGFLTNCWHWLRNKTPSASQATGH